MDYPMFFRAATGHEPFPYQERMSLAEKPPPLVRAPTGAGKTAAAVLAWLWRRRFAAPEVCAATPRRLAYCLPMRVLVEQTRGEVKKWIANLEKEFPDAMAEAPQVHVLMGGEAARDWRIHPEADAVLVGTQDMLLSRALNRGYGMSPDQWSTEFGFLHNDCLWVLDEVQLMGAGLATSCQLAAFRERFGTYGASSSLWMSATLEPTWLRTVDFPNPPAAFELTPEELKREPLAKRMQASKTVRRGRANLKKASAIDIQSYATEVAAQVLKAHRPGTLTLAVFNTVERAVAVHRALAQGSGRGEAPELRLVHSRFRPNERKRWDEEFLRRGPPAAGRIVVSTQVIEAGVDISARALLTELAPWASIVQRLGRCNRFGDDDEAEVTWFDLGDEAALPYSAEQLATARSHLKALEGEDASPAALAAIPVGPVEEPTHVLRRRDLLDLFDTTPDLARNDIDVGRFIREGEDLDVLVFWRDVEGEPDDGEPAPRREELCPVPVGLLREFLKKIKKERVPAWQWDYLDGRWIPAKPSELRPGQRILLPCAAGGYDATTGWDARSKARVEVVPGPETAPPAGMPDNTGTERQRRWQTLRGHSRRTHAKMALLLKLFEPLALPDEVKAALLLGARSHDAGKAHPLFQNALIALLPEELRKEREGVLWAKSDSTKRLRHKRGSEKVSFSHELAGALALLHSPLRDGMAPWTWDLTCYLVAAHHGKVRLSLRSLPGEPLPPTGGRFARGVWEGDELPAVDLGDGVVLPATRLDLACMDLGLDDQGRASWQERVLTLRDRADLGPFRLTFLEAVVRVADWTASGDPGEEV